MEKIRTTVHILGKEYTMTSYDPESYVQRVASFVDRKMTELSLSTRLPYAQLAVLTALNVADEYFKEVEASENLRRQLKEYLEEATKLKLELSEAKREIFKLQNKKA